MERQSSAQKICKGKDRAQIFCPEQTLASPFRENAIAISLRLKVPSLSAISNGRFLTDAPLPLSLSLISSFYTDARATSKIVPIFKIRIKNPHPKNDKPYFLGPKIFDAHFGLVAFHGGWL